jgi:hypothetical protein
MDDRDRGGERPDLRLVNPGTRGLPPSGDRLARLELEDRIRVRRMRGETASKIAREVGVELKFVTSTLRKFEREYKRRAEQQADLEGAAYRHRMIDHLERLKARCWEQIELAEQSKKETRQEMLKGPEGNTTHQKATVRVIPGETTPSLLAELRQLEVALGRLHGVKLDEELPLPAPVFQKNDVLVIQPAAPLSLDRLAQLNEVIRKRQNGGAERPTPSLPPSNGSGNGNGRGPG